MHTNIRHKATRLEMCAWGLCRCEKSLPTSEISRLYSPSCHTDIKGNFLCRSRQRQSPLMSVTRRGVTCSCTLTTNTCRGSHKRMRTTRRRQVQTVLTPLSAELQRRTSLRVLPTSLLNHCCVVSFMETRHMW